jgi:hypothetical protein
MQEINLLAESPDNQYFLQTARDKTYGSLLARCALRSENERNNGKVVGSFDQSFTDGEEEVDTLR